MKLSFLQLACLAAIGALAKCPSPLKLVAIEDLIGAVLGVGTLDVRGEDGTGVGIDEPDQNLRAAQVHADGVGHLPLLSTSPG